MATTKAKATETEIASKDTKLSELYSMMDTTDIIKDVAGRSLDTLAELGGSLSALNKNIKARIDTNTEILEATANMRKTNAIVKEMVKTKKLTENQDIDSMLEDMKKLQKSLNIK